MSRTVGIVQPHEEISVAEQIYLIELHAREEGVAISDFVGSDEILRMDLTAAQSLMESIAGGETGSIVFVDAVLDKIPPELTRLCREMGCKVLAVDRHRAGLGVP